MNENKVVRLTLEEVLQNQKDLRKFLNELIDQDRWLDGEEEEENFYELLSRATLGVGSNEEVVTYWHWTPAEYFEGLQDEKVEELKDKLEKIYGTNLTTEDFNEDFALTICFKSLWRFAEKCAEAREDSHPLADDLESKSYKIDYRLDFLSPGSLWTMLKSALMDVFGDALQTAAQISPERQPKEKLERRKDWRE